MGIKIQVNGGAQVVPEGTTVSALLENMEYNEKRVAVWIEKRQLLRKEYPDTVVKDGEKITVRRIVAGG